MIQLIADSGSTKTHWMLVRNNEVLQPFLTAGLNPYHVPDSDMLHIIGEDVMPRLQDAPHKIYFYGSGCAAEESKKKVKSIFSHFFPEAQIEIETDLLGAARGLLGNSQGFIGILGTGSNTGTYDGTKITHNVDSLGWILGDEGSGVSIGKEILRSWLRGDFSMEEEMNLAKFCPLTRDEIISRVYYEKNPNRFVSSFAKFASEHPSPKINDIIISCFNDLMKQVIRRYERDSIKELNFVGSIAWYFKDHLKIAAEKNNHTIGKILKSPIEELMKYHLSKS